MSRTEAEPTEYNDANSERELARAVCRNDVPTVFRLLNRGNVRTIYVKQLGSMPIHCAALFGEAGLVNHIIRLDPTSVNVKDLKGDTPLHIAARGGHMDVVRVLLEKSETDHLSINNQNQIPLSVVDPKLRNQYIELIDELRPSREPIIEGMVRILGFFGIYNTKGNTVTTSTRSSDESTQSLLRSKSD
jgi:ankyrin repeat protein